jgi:cell shape-determining protein MreC
MYLAPKQQSFMWRFRMVIALLLFFVFMWIGGGRLIVTLLAKISAVMPHYIVSPKVSDEVAMFRARIADMERERDLLNSTRGLDTNTIVAYVRIAPGFFFGDTLVIDQGAAAGVSVGDTVTTEDGIALGTIERVDTAWSSVLLLSRPGSKTTFRLSLSENASTSAPTKNILTEAEGVGGGEFRIDMPVSLSIEVGSVVWWGEHPNYPVGVVDRIDQSPARQMQSVFIRLPVSLSALSRVLVVQ